MVGVPDSGGAIAMTGKPDAVGGIGKTEVATGAAAVGSGETAPLKESSSSNPPLDEPRKKTNDDKENSQTYFRVEGGGVETKSSMNRIQINPDQTISIKSGCSGQLCISTNGPNHALYYVSEKRPGGTVIVFEVDEKLHREILSQAVPQKPIPGVSRDINAPKIVDETKGQPSVNLELPKVCDKLLEKNSSNARKMTQEEFEREFKK